MTAGAADDEPGLTDRERARLDELRQAESLTDLRTLTGTASEHDAYFEAKREWFDLRGKSLSAAPEPAVFPGTTVSTPRADCHVHGVTHAGTAAEREYLRGHVTSILDRGHAVYCEQGIRSMYFAQVDGVCEMDDYRWAMAQCKQLDTDSKVGEMMNGEFLGIGENIDDLTARFRETAFSLIDAVGDAEHGPVSRALGDIAGSFLTSHEDLATGSDFESFAIRKRAANDPTHLPELQTYYDRRFLPQPVEREWLRRHDPELELVTHARNARMADYVMYQATPDVPIHLIVGAAHQPGIAYYLEQYRDGSRSLDGFEPMP
jgi:hypothetical protein